MKLNSKKIKYSGILAAALLLVGLGVLIGQTNPLARPAEIETKKTAPAASIENPKELGKAIVTKVIDGDTVITEGGTHIRLLGIDTDEKDYPCYDPARLRLEELVLGETVTLESDQQDLDQYSRQLRYVFVGNENINEKLVREGLAVARFYPENQKYKAQISQAEAEAINNKIGCKWSGHPQTKTANAPAQESTAPLQWKSLPGDSIAACAAKDHIGQQIIIQGKIAEAYKSDSQALFLNFGKAYPDNCFVAVIFKSDLFKFTAPEIAYTGKTVRIKGTIQLYEGKPEIILADPSQIEFAQ